MIQMRITSETWSRVGPRLPIGLTLLVLAWSYWPIVVRMSHTWSTNHEYSHGYLVPILCLWILWSRRNRKESMRGASSWWGIPVILAALLLRFTGAFFFIDWFEEVSLIPCLAGVCLLFSGWPGLRWAGPAIAFLIFMIPLPYGLEDMLAVTLRGLATTASTFVLQTLGVGVRREGNAIIGPHSLTGVEEACSGLGMLVSFVGLSSALIILVRRPWLDQLIIFISAVPIAIVANVVRISATVIAQEYLASAAAKAFIHDWAGWLMIVFALGLLALELRLLDWLLICVEDPQPRAPLPEWPPGMLKQPEAMPVQLNEERS